MPPRKNAASPAPRRSKSPAPNRARGRSKSPAPARSRSASPARSKSPARGKSPKKSPGKVPGRVGRPPKVKRVAKAEVAEDEEAEEDDEEDKPEAPAPVASEPAPEPPAPSLPAVDVPAPAAPPAAAASPEPEDGIQVPAVLLGWSEPLGVAGVLTAAGYVVYHWKLPFDVERELSPLADAALALMPILAIAYRLLDAKASKRRGLLPFDGADSVAYFTLYLGGAITQALGPTIAASLAPALSAVGAPALLLKAVEAFVSEGPGLFAAAASIALLLAVSPSAPSWSWAAFAVVLAALLGFDFSSGCSVPSGFNVAWLGYTFAVAAVLVSSTRFLADLFGGDSPRLSQSLRYACGALLAWAALRGTSGAHGVECHRAELPAFIAPAIPAEGGDVALRVINWAAALFIFGANSY